MREAAGECVACGAADGSETKKGVLTGTDHRTFNRAAPDDPPKTTPERAEEWLSKQVEGLRKTFSKAILGLVATVVPLLLVLSGLSTANKVTCSILWVSVLLNLLLIAVVCSHRIETRKLRSDLSKKLEPPALAPLPPLPELDGFDRAILIRLVVEVRACSLDRIASYGKKALHEVAFALDKLHAHGFIRKVTMGFGGVEYAATEKGRAHCMSAKKQP